MSVASYSSSGTCPEHCVRQYQLWYCCTAVCRREKKIRGGKRNALLSVVRTVVFTVHPQRTYCSVYGVFVCGQLMINLLSFAYVKYREVYKGFIIATRLVVEEFYGNINHTIVLASLLTYVCFSLPLWVHFMYASIHDEKNPRAFLPRIYLPATILLLWIIVAGVGWDGERGEYFLKTYT